MIIQHVTQGIDVIIPNAKADIDRLSLTELIDHIETENTLYYIDRMKRKNRRLQEQRRHKPSYIFRRLLTAVI